MPDKLAGRTRRSAAKQIKDLRTRVHELEETFLAIKRGRVDAVVVNGEEGDQVFTLQGAEHPYRVLVETMNEGAATLDEHGTVLYANASFGSILGIATEEIIGTSLQKYLEPQEQIKLNNLIHNSLKDESHGEVILATSDGKRRLVRMSLSPIHEFGVRTICVIATDMTELSGANEALKASEDILRNLSGRLLRLQDEERRRISRDLHDVTGQKLAVLSMNLSSALKNRAVTKNEEMNRLLAESIGISNDVNKEIRTLSYLLHPPLLDELGLSSAIEWYAQGFENRTGIRTSVDIPTGFVRLAPDAEVALFRVVQESLVNVHRYSGSATAQVRAMCDGTEVRLQIGDAGIGIGKEMKVSAPTATALGVGIQGMKERLRQLSGRLEITSVPGSGTLVTAILPVCSHEAKNLVDYADSANQDVQSTAVEVVSGQNGWRKRILIADDHDVLRRGIRTMIESDPGLEVCGEAVDGKDALEKTLSQGPDLVILDINMPVMNGLDVLRQIVRHRPKIKVLAFSVHDSKQIVEETLAAGAHGYLSKATAGQHLVHEVRALLNSTPQVVNA
ncbi:MAG TPA: response regulator [Candidatus Saccharimonadales bacterium]|jgi:two-component system NarL family sensor kinase|nr:response regulator [Candidatus Saccharimonadales bacterium]